MVGHVDPKFPTGSISQIIYIAHLFWAILTVSLSAVSKCLLFGISVLLHPYPKKKKLKKNNGLIYRQPANKWKIVFISFLQGGTPEETATPSATAPAADAGKTAAAVSTTPAADSKTPAADPKTPAADPKTPAAGEEKPNNNVQSDLNSLTVLSDVTSTLYDCKNQLYVEGSEVISAADDAMHVGSRVLLATVGGLLSLFDSVVMTTSAVAKTTAQGYHWVNEYIKPMPLIGTITTGVDNVLTGITNTLFNSVDNNVMNRKQMIDDMHTQLDNARARSAAMTVKAKTAALTNGNSNDKTAPTIPAAPAAPTAPAADAATTAPAAATAPAADAAPPAPAPAAPA